MTKVLQTSLLLAKPDGTSAVGTRMDVHALNTSKDPSLDALRFIRGTKARDMRVG